MGLALGAVFQANRADQERLKTAVAERDAKERLWVSYLAEARARRVSVQIGRRFDSLEAIKNAAAMRPSPELRKEAVACMTVADLRPAKFRPQTATTALALDANFDRYAMADAAGRIQVRQRADDRLLAELPKLTNEVSFILPMSPDGNFLPVIYRDGSTYIWDLRRRETISGRRCVFR